MKIYPIIFLFISIIFSSYTDEKHPFLFLNKGKEFHFEEFSGKSQPKTIELRADSSSALKEGIMTVINNSAKEGARPVIHFHKIPKEFICHMRIKMDGKSYNPKNPWLDIGGGHRNHFRFKANEVQFSSEDKELSKRKIDKGRPVNMLPLNEWLLVTVEIEKGKIGLSINGKTQIYEGSKIETGNRLKIGIKAIPKGKLHLDYIRVWEVKK